MADDEIQIEFEPYDSEIVKIEGVIKELNRTRRTKATSVEGWTNEITQRFSEVGFRVNVVLSQIEGTQAGDGPMVPTEGTRIHTLISIEGRLDELKVGEYDHEQQSYEVRNNIRGMKGLSTDHQTNSNTFISAPKKDPAGTTRTASGLIVPKS